MVLGMALESAETYQGNIYLVIKSTDDKRDLNIIIKMEKEIPQKDINSRTNSKE
jgi:hypothetical protein